jgi:hypothetical protein
MAAAHDNIMQAERISRSGGPEERTVALAQAAKCLVLLEHKLSQAEAFVMEAAALADRTGGTSTAVAFATGMIAAHRGEREAAEEAFREARQLARERGERLAEFCAIEHWVMLEIDRGDYERASELAEHLDELGAKVRPGSEAPTARALKALAALCAGDEAAKDGLEAAIEELRAVDAKYELGFLLTRWGHHDLSQGRCVQVRARSEAALEVAQAIRRPSDTAIAHALLAQCALRAEDQELHEAQRQALQELRSETLSSVARERIATVLGSTDASD